MSLPNQNAPRVRRHKRRINDDGSDLALAVRSFVDSKEPADEQDLFARQADGANGIGPGRGASAPPMGGGFGDDHDTDSTTDADADTDADPDADPDADADAATSTTTRGAGIVRPTPTVTTPTLTRNLFPPITTTTTSAAAVTTSSSQGFLDGLLDSIFDPTTTSSSTLATSTSSSSSTTTASSSSIRSSSTSGASSSSRAPIVPITATAVVTSTPTASIVASTASSTPKSTASSAGPIIGIVAGSLVGVVVLSGLVGFLFKKYRNKEDPYEANPFDRDAFQRHSTMIPDRFDSDDGHGDSPGAGGIGPEMSEHYQQYNNYAPHYESGISAGAAGAVAGMAYNETGRPRPPTMFAKHAAGVQQNAGPQVGGYYKGGEYSMPVQDYHVPPGAAFANNHHEQAYLDEPGFGGQAQRSVSPAPQLPPLAAFGGDPYSIAGVGRGQGQQNVANPYAHLDRSLAPQPGFAPGAVVRHDTAGSNSVSSRDESADQRHASISAAEALAAGLAHQSSLSHSASPQPGQKGEYATAARRGASEGRSGTPDLPNVQQTYAQDPQNPFEAQHEQQQQHYHQQQQQQPGLQVRNLVPNTSSAGQRPISNASSFADPEDAYGGVY